jgi:hypothetical protein
VERDPRTDDEELAELRRAAAVHRAAQLALSPSQRLALVDALCREAADLPRQAVAEP